MGWAARANEAERAAAKKGHRKRRVTLSVGTPNPRVRWRQWHDTGTQRVMKRGGKARRPYTTKPAPGVCRQRRRMRNAVAKESRRRNRGT